MRYASRPTKATSQTGAALARHALKRAPRPAALGNQALLRRLQAKLTIGAVNDPLEREADAVAEQVMRIPDPATVSNAAPPRISRKCAACEEEEKLQTKRASADAAEGAAPAVVNDVLRSPGQPLAPVTRAFFEPRYGCDFGNVRVHVDARAQESARSVHAHAYTVGRNIVFAGGAYRPNTTYGDRLLAHELAHVVQQQGASDAQIQRATDAAAATAATANDPDQAPAPEQAQPPATSGPAQPDVTQAGSAGTGEVPPELANYVAEVEQLKSAVAAVIRDQLPPPPAGRTETAGATFCVWSSPKPKTMINTSAVTECLMPCVVAHEQSHVDFMGQQCENLWIAFARMQYWLEQATQAAKQNDPGAANRAIKQLETAISEAKQAADRYNKYMAQTCRYDEGNAYAAGIEACNTDDVRKSCAAAGQTDEYNKQMAAWRRFMQNPPNCANPP